MVIFIDQNSGAIGTRSLTSYYDLFVSLERALGKVLLPVDRNASEPNRLISSNAAFLELSRSVATEIFSENGCKTKDDPVGLYPTLDALGRIKRAQKDCEALDVVAADFLEQVGAAVIELLPSQVSSIDKPNERPVSESGPRHQPDASRSKARA